MPKQKDTVQEAPQWGNIAVDRLQSLVSRIETLEEERKALAGDIRDLYTEAKSAGFVPGILKRLVALRRKDPAEVDEQETLLDVYRHALERGTGTLSDVVQAAVPSAVQDEFDALPARERRSALARETEPVG